MDLAVLWLLIVGFGILMYVVLDGFDLGLGILYPWFRNRQDREIMMQSVAPVWDGNETWLVFGGVTLFAAFPAAYSVILSQLYMPIMVMLLALIFRGVAFEYRFKATTSIDWWDRSFSFGSTLAAFCQGVVLGALVQGMQGPLDDLSQPSLNWLTPFSILTGFAVMAGYALLACGWLVMKTEGTLQQRGARLGRNLLLAVMGFMGLVSVWTPWMEPAIAERWFSLPNFFLLAPLPLLSILAAVILYRDLAQPNLPHEKRPFFLAVCLFILGFGGLVVGMFPYIIPRQLTIWEALAPANSLNFLLVGVVVFIPVILAYTLFGYKTFSGKTRPGQGGY